jgi:hypothetical protein
MRYYIEKVSGDLRIVADEKDRAFLRECAKDETLQSDATMHNAFETLICNSGLQWVSPDELGALTSAPILGTYDETGTNVLEAWWYPGYELRSPQQDLLERGECVFKKAME